MIAIIYLIFAMLFFARIGRESRVPARFWAVLAVLTFVLGCWLASGVVLGGIAAHVVLFLVLCVVWVLTPRQSAAERMRRAVEPPVEPRPPGDNPYQPSG